MQFLDLTDFSIKFTKFEKFYDKKFEEKRVVGVRRRHYLRFEKKNAKICEKLGQNDDFVDNLDKNFVKKIRFRRF